MFVWWWRLPQNPPFSSAPLFSEELASKFWEVPIPLVLKCRVFSLQNYPLFYLFVVLTPTSLQTLQLRTTNLLCQRLHTSLQQKSAGWREEHVSCRLSSPANIPSAGTWIPASRSWIIIVILNSKKEQQHPHHSWPEPLKPSSSTLLEGLSLSSKLLDPRHFVFFPLYPVSWSISRGRSRFLYCHRCDSSTLPSVSRVSQYQHTKSLHKVSC